MKLSSSHSDTATQPQLLGKAQQLAKYLKQLSVPQLAKAMHISEELAHTVAQQYQQWGSGPTGLAIDSFVGDIYSGLQAAQLSPSDRQCAQDRLVILSGLYGLLRPFDAIQPYRLEMGYKFSNPQFANLYTYWADSVNALVQPDQLIINTSSVEYSRLITKFRPPSSIITPCFLTINPKTGQPAQVVVHSKIARGALARWLLTSRATDQSQLQDFNLLGYTYSSQLSQPHQPTYICQDFGGIGLSIRLN